MTQQAFVFIARHDGADLAPPAFLDDWERARAGALKDGDARNAFILAHALRRVALSRQFGLPPERWRIAELGHIRPRLLDDPQIRMSHTHAKGFAAVALARGAEIGIDAESLDAGFTLSLAPLIAAGDEMERLKGVGQGEARLALGRLWTRKEAIAKALGLGQVLPFHRFGLDAALSPRFDDHVHEGSWTLAEQDCFGHAVCVALRAEGRIEPPVFWGSEEIMPQRSA